MEAPLEMIPETLGFNPEWVVDRISPRAALFITSDLDELVVTDTIPLHEDARACRKIRQLSVAGLLAETILRIYTEESVSSLFIE